MVRRMPARYWVTEARVPVILLDGITPPSAVHTGVDGLVSVDTIEETEILVWTTGTTNPMSQFSRTP